MSREINSQYFNLGDDSEAGNDTQRLNFSSNEALDSLASRREYIVKEMLRQRTTTPRFARDDVPAEEVAKNAKPESVTK